MREEDDEKMPWSKITDGIETLIRQIPGRHHCAVTIVDFVQLARSVPDDLTPEEVERLRLYVFRMELPR